MGMVMNPTLTEMIIAVFIRGHSCL